MDYRWQYYDLVLLGVVGSVAIGGIVGYATALSLPVTIIVSSVVSVALMVHALFVNGPVDDPADLTEEVETLN